MDWLNPPLTKLLSNCNNSPIDNSTLNCYTLARQQANAPNGVQSLERITTMKHPHRQTVIDRALAQNLKISDQQVEVSNTLREVALDYVQSYKGTNSFVQDIAVKLADYGRLSVAQMRGALNVMVSEARIVRGANRLIDQVQHNEPLVMDFGTDGYRHSDDRKAEAAQLHPATANKLYQIYGFPPHTHPASPPVEHLPADLPAVPQVEAPLEKRPFVPNGIYTVFVRGVANLADASHDDYRTIKLDDCPDKFNKPAGTQIAYYLNGPDNEANYTGFAFVTGKAFGLWQRFRNATDLSFALVKLLSTDDGYTEYGKAYAMRSGNCFICNRRLTTPLSIQSGIGPICAGNLGIDQEQLASANKVKGDKALADMGELFPE